MNNEISSVIMFGILFGWIPLLAIGHAISFIIRAYRHTIDISVESIVVNTNSIESLDEDMVDKIVLNNITKKGE
jgi:hypothetical protein